MKNPEVSIITPCYNSIKYLKKTIESIRNQTFNNWELLLIDDASTDETLDFIKHLSKTDERIRYYSFEKNQGPAHARNKGISMASGRFIAFLDADDLWLPEKLSKQIDFMKTKNCALSYGPYLKILEDGQKKGQIDVPEFVTYKDLLKTCSIGCLTAMYDTKVLGKVEMPIIRKRQDYGLWLRILKKVPKAYAMNETLAIYRLRKNSISANKFSAARYQWKIYREVENISFFKSLRYFISYFYRGIFKTYFS